MTLGILPPGPPRPTQPPPARLGSVGAWVRLGTVLFGERPKVKRVAASEGDDGTTPCGDSDTYAGFGGLDSYSGAGPTAKVLD